MVKVYSVEWCGPCNKLKKYLEKLGVQYETITVADGKEDRNEVFSPLQNTNTRKSRKTERGIPDETFHQLCMASWDSLPVCILCGIDVDLTNESAVRFCKGCSGYAHVACIQNPCDDWKCPFCSRTDDPYLNVSYTISDKQLNVLSPYCEQFASK